MKYEKYRRFILPKVIVDNILFVHSKNPLKDTNKSSLEVAFAIVNDIICKSDMFNRDDNYPLHHIPMHSKDYLEVKYGNDYRRYIEWLWLHNIIWFDESKEGYSTHYYLQSKETYYQLIEINRLDTSLYTYSSINNIKISPLTPINKGIQDIQKNGTFTEFSEVIIRINKSNRSFLTRDYEKESKDLHNSPKHIRAMGQYYRKNLKIDFNGAMHHSIIQYQHEQKSARTSEEENRAYRRFTTRVSSIYDIHQGSKNKSLRFKRNQTNERLDTNLTNMASDLRPFLIGYSDMTYFDLKNSQPVLFNILLKNKRIGASPHQLEELDRYYVLTTSGDWYEELATILDCDRETAKEAWMVIAYSSNSSKRYRPLKKQFSKHFPFINSIIETYKETNHNQFAIELQKVESKIFIGKICKELVKEGIFPYTFHDAVMVPTTHSDATLRIMKSILEKELGSIPEIRIN